MWERSRDLTKEKFVVIVVLHIVLGVLFLKNLGGEILALLLVLVPVYGVLDEAFRPYACLLFPITGIILICAYSRIKKGEYLDR